MSNHLQPEELYGTQFSFEGVRFNVSSEGQVIVNGSEDIGHIEECLEEGKRLMELIDICQDIELPPI